MKYRMQIITTAVAIFSVYPATSHAQSAQSDYKSLKACYESLRDVGVNNNGKFYAGFSDDPKGIRESLLLDGAKQVGSTSVAGIYAFNDNGAYFYRYKNTAASVPHDGPYDPYGRCIKVSIPGDAESSAQPIFYDLLWDNRDKLGPMIWGHSAACGGFDGKGPASRGTVIEAVQFQDDQNSDYFKTLADALSAKIISLELDPQKLAPITVDAYKKLIQDGFSGCMNTSSANLNNAAKYELGVLTDRFGGKSGSGNAAAGSRAGAAQ